MAHKLPFLIFTTLIFIISACDENDADLQPTNVELLAGFDDFGKTWQIEIIEVELGSLDPKSCLTDNFIKYYPDGRYEMGEGLTKCDPFDPQAYAGSWDFNRDQSELAIQIEDSIQVWEIDILTEIDQSITSIFKEGERTYILRSSN